MLGRLHEGLEGVHRILGGPPPLHRQTGATPAWWSPSAIDFRATEIMVWYEGHYSGVGRAVYSGYDESSKTLWIYEYACQHDQLWPPRAIPAGEQFSMTKQSAAQTSENATLPNDYTEPESVLDNNAQLQRLK